MFPLVCLILLSHSTSTAAQAPSPPAAKSIFILAGQSNMAGRGGVVNFHWDGHIPPHSASNPLVLHLNSRLAWEEASEPLHRDIDVKKTCGVGPGMSFANSVLKKEPGLGPIGLVPCAVGGTNISEWKHGSKLYDQLLIRAQAALRNGGGLVRALLWFQGESDTNSYDDAELYKNHLEKFLTDIRSDLLSPYLPVIQVALASAEGEYIDVVRKAQLGIELPNVKCVDAKGMHLEPDELHLTSGAQVKLGKKMAKAFLRIMADS